MKREYKQGDILVYIGDEVHLKGKTITLWQIRTNVDGELRYITTERGSYREQYLDENYMFIGNPHEQDAIIVDEPDRYLTTSGKQLYDVLREDLLTPEQFEGFVLGNIYKYVKRYKRKNGVKDLNKAKDYIDILIKLMEENEHE